MPYRYFIILLMPYNVIILFYIYNNLGFKLILRTEIYIYMDLFISIPVSIFYNKKKSKVIFVSSIITGYNENFLEFFICYYFNCFFMLPTDNSLSNNEL